MEFLERIRQAEKEGKEDEALYILFDAIDDMHTAGKFAEVDDILRRVDLDSFGVDVLVGFLTITSKARHRLTERAAFCKKVRERFVALKVEDLEAVLKGLES